ncbi:MAG: sulfurtransferase [Rhodobacteraceae bacterium]|nr:sulfurtransferase [Paracoccaceae bacterium]
MRAVIRVFLAFWIGLAAAAHAERLTTQPLVDPAWLAAHLNAADMVIVDVRDPVGGTSAYDTGHVPGAVSAPYASYGWREEVGGVPGMLPPVEKIAARIGALGVTNDTQVVIVAEGANSTEFGKATRVYWTFRVLGHDAVTILDGGYRAWLADGQATAPMATAPVPATFTADFQPQLVATTDQVRAAIGQGVNLVDGRPDAQYRGLEKSPVARVPGTLPGAVSLPHSNVYTGTEFAGHDAVARLSALAGVKDSQPTITFCNTGHWASIAWFALSEVEKRPNVAMYDGSMADWTRDPANQVVVRN